MKDPIAYWEQVLETDPANVDARVRLAEAWRDAGRTDKAVRQFVVAARMLVDSGAELTATEVCRSVLDIDPTHPGIFEILDELATRGTAVVSQIAQSIARSARRRRGELASIGLVHPESQGGAIAEQALSDGIETHRAETVEMDQFMREQYADMFRQADSYDSDHDDEPTSTSGGEFTPVETVAYSMDIPSKLMHRDLNTPEAEPDVEYVSDDAPKSGARQIFNNDTVNYALTEEQRRALFEKPTAEHLLEMPRPSITPQAGDHDHRLFQQETRVAPPPEPGGDTVRNEASPFATPKRTVVAKMAPVGADDIVDALRASKPRSERLNNEGFGPQNTADTVVAGLAEYVAPSGGPDELHDTPHVPMHRIDREGPGSVAPLSSSSSAPARTAVPDVPALPSSRLLQQIPWDVTREMVGRLGLQPMKAGAQLLEHTSRRLVLVTSGEVAMWVRLKNRETRLVQILRPGDFFGQEQFLTGKAPAVTMQARSDGHVLAITEDGLGELAEYDPQIWEALWEQADLNLLSVALARSNIFGTLPEDQRSMLVGEFERCHMGEGELVIVQGERGHGMYLVISGAVEVTREKGGETSRLGVLRQGKFFGTVKETASKATVTATCATSLFVLPREALVRVLRVSSSR